MRGDITDKMRREGERTERLELIGGTNPEANGFMRVQSAEELRGNTGKRRLASGIPV